MEIIWILDGVELLINPPPLRHIDQSLFLGGVSFVLLRVRVCTCQMSMAQNEMFGSL